MPTRSAFGSNPEHCNRNQCQSLVTETGLAFPSGPCRRAGITFSDAEAVISGGCGDDGDGDWTLDAYRQRRDREVAVVMPWADAQGLWIDPEMLNEARKAGMEHLILPSKILREQSGRW